VVGEGGQRERETYLKAFLLASVKALMSELVFWICGG